MKARDLLEKLNTTLSCHSVLWATSIIEEISEIVDNSKLDEDTKITQISILLEAMIKAFTVDKDLNRSLLEIKLYRWKNHFGTPTITFLLTFLDAILKTITLLTKLYLSSTKETLVEKPWVVVRGKEELFDEQNQTFCRSNCIEEVELPRTVETTGEFLRTHNPQGGFTTTPCDPVSQQFLSHAEQLAKKEGRVLEIGAAFGAASLKALTFGSTVFCNDIDPKNLAVVARRAKQAGHNYDATTGDGSKLILVPGEFPDALSGLPEASFAAILVCRVLHFFEGSKIEDSFRQLSKLLEPGGKIYVVCETPFLGNWKKFIPEYHRRLSEGKKWPGEIDNPAEYETSGRADLLPKFVHWMTKEVLERTLLDTGYKVESVTYIDRSGKFPQDLLLPEYRQESVGAVALKL